MEPVALRRLRCGAFSNPVLMVSDLMAVNFLAVKNDISGAADPEATVKIRLKREKWTWERVLVLSYRSNGYDP